MAFVSNLKEVIGIVVYIALFTGLGWLWLATASLLVILPVYGKVLLFAYVVYITVGPGRSVGSDTDYMNTSFKSLKVLGWGADYFPVKLHKTVDLDPNKSYLFCLSPHGIFSYSMLYNFATDVTGFSKLFPGLVSRCTTINWNFRTPFLREVLIRMGVLDSNFPTLVKALKRSGTALVLETGGTLESLHTAPGTYHVVLLKRKGFVRVALAAGAPLVPVIGFGEPDTYDTQNNLPPSSPMSRFQRFLMKTTGATLPIFTGAFWMFPHRVPLNTVVGAPLEVPQYSGDLHSKEGKKLVDEYHAKYVAALQQLWEEHKDRFARGRRRSLTLVA